MKKVINNRFQETYYEETLANGLKVVLWEKKDFVKSFFMIATPFGALDLEQIDENQQEYKFHSGLAHFLEHKMFEKKEQDVMEQFTAMGASCNAFTSYTETAYYFSTSEHPEKPLNLLLDFVQNLDISEESVEKEKGIIIQELDMYEQMSESKIINETMSALFENHPLKYDIGGNHESVNATTKKELEQCYKLNYHPSRMILVGVSGHNPTKLMDVIRNNQEKKTFPEISKVKRKVVDEKREVHKSDHVFAMDVSMPKVNLAFKCEGIKDIQERNKKEWSYKLLFDMYFSSLNEDYQNWLDKNIVNSSFSFEIDFGYDYGLIMFYSETTKVDEFLLMMIETLKNIDTVSEKRLEQLKRRYFGVNINSLTSGKQVAITYMRNYFSELDFFSSLEVIETITSEDLLKALKELDLKNYTKVIIEPIHQ